MSLFGSLFTGVSTLAAQSQALSMISNNIANTSTTGYKADLASFQSLVTTSSSGTVYNPGGVRVTAKHTVDKQGLINTSSSATDIAISGTGFFVVKNSAENSAQDETFYTRAGSFSENSLGYLVNDAGYYLYGWRLDANGQIPSANADISSLEPVNVSFLNGVATATSSVELGLNLDSEQALGATSISFTDPTDATELTTALSATSPFTYDFDIILTDENGVETTTNISVTETSTLASVAAAINAVAGVSANIINNKLVVTVDDVQSKVTVENGSIGNVVTSLFGASSVTQLGYDFQRTVTIYDALGAAREAVVSFKKIATNQWSVEIRAADPTYTQPINRTTGVVDLVNGDDGYIASGTIYFNSNGSINSITGQLSTNVSIHWDDSTSGAGTQDISFDFGMDSAGATTNGAVTQYSADYNVSYVNQNGAELGERTGISIDADGYVIASFSNGETRKLYKLPVATFANPNGLEALSGNVYSQTTASGEYNLREAGSGGAGTVQGGALEASNVDLSDEFTKMIIVQRAYSAGTKVISTADEMLQELMQTKR